MRQETWIIGGDSRQVLWGRGEKVNKEIHRLERENGAPYNINNVNLNGSYRVYHSI